MAASITDEGLEDEFKTFGITVDDLVIVDKLKEIAGEFRWDSSTLVEEWMAFAATGELGLSLEHLDEFRQKKLSDQREKLTKSRVVIRQPRNNIVYNKDNIDELLITDQDVGMMEMYQTPETKTSIKRLHTTPESGTKMRHTLSGRTPTTFSPMNISPSSATPAKRYEARDNAGEVVSTYNPSGMMENNISWKGHHKNLQVTHVEDEPLTERFKYMFQKISDKSQVLNEQIDKMTLLLKEAHSIEEFASALAINQDDVAVVGRIGCDTNGKLNSSSVILRESGTSASHGHPVRLNVSHVDQYSLFQGQIAAMKGKNTTGDQFVVSSFYEGVLPEPYKSQNSDSLSVFVTAGPFTTSDSLDYQPLTDLLNLVKKEQPDVVIMIGPFVDAKHESIEKCELGETFQQFFSRQMMTIGELAKSLSTKFLIIPSQRDANHDFVYPQPPFDVEEIVNSNKSEKKIAADDIAPLTFLSDPCTVEVNGFTFGITSTDILFHLGGEEITHPPGASDKMGRLVKHLLTQQCYYPVYPPSEDICIEYERFAQHAHLPCKPDVLIVPSDLRYFAKNVMGCLSINPGRLTKGLVGGSYCRILLKKDPTMKDVVDRSLVQIKQKPQLAVSYFESQVKQDILDVLLSYKEISDDFDDNHVVIEWRGDARREMKIQRRII